MTPLSTTSYVPGFVQVVVKNDFVGVVAEPVKQRLPRREARRPIRATASGAEGGHTAQNSSYSYMDKVPCS